jgi:hypothetical protein
MSSMVVPGVGAGAPVQAHPDPSEVYLAAADLDRDDDGNMEIIVVGRNGWVWVIKADGGEMSGWARKITGSVMAPPAIADVSGDGYLDIVLSDADYKTWVVHHSGARLEGWPGKWYGCSLIEWDEEFHPADRTIPLPSPVVVDFECDGGLEVIQGSLFECVTAWTGRGEVLGGFPYTLGGGSSALAVAEVRGVDTIVITGGGDGYLYGFRPPVIPLGPEVCQAPWPAAYFSIARNCVYPRELMPDKQEPGERLLVEQSFHVFPNPATTSRITFSLETETGGTADIDIFDINGVKIKSLAFEATAKTEYDADISGLGNGLYVCKLEIRDGGRRVTDFFKLAVRR